MIDTDRPLPSREATQRVEDATRSEGFHPVKWALAELTNEPYGASILLEGKDAKRFRHYAHLGKFDRAWDGDNLRVWNVDPKAAGAPERPEPEPIQVKPAEPHPELFDPTPDPRDAELAALRARIAELERQEPAPLLPEPDALMSDYGPVGTDDITGDLLLEAFEENEAETASVVQTLSALRLKHLSEQLNVERARLDREHQATGVANPRSASIDRLLGLLTRRGEV